MLNVGIGGGIFEAHAHARGASVHSLDPNWASLRSHAADAVSRLVVGRLQEMPFANDTFDAVVVSEDLEHLSPDDMRLALSEIERVLHPGGRIIGPVPFEENLGDAMVICPNCSEIFHKVGHLQSFSVESMSRELMQYFEEVDCYQRAFMVKTRVGLKELAVDLVRNLIVRSGVLTRDKQVVFIGTKCS